MLKILSAAEKALYILALVLLTWAMLQIIADVSGRYFFNHPIRGTLEITEFLMVAVVFFALANVQHAGAQISVDIVFEHLPQKMKYVLEIVIYFIGLLLFTLLTWQGVLKTMAAWSGHETPMGISYPTWPAWLSMCLGSAILCFRYVADITSKLRLGPGRGH